MIFSLLTYSITCDLVKFSKSSNSVGFSGFCSNGSMKCNLIVRHRLLTSSIVSPGNDPACSSITCIASSLIPMILCKEFALPVTRICMANKAELAYALARFFRANCPFFLDMAVANCHTTAANPHIAPICSMNEITIVGLSMLITIQLVIQPITPITITKIRNSTIFPQLGYLMPSL